MPFPPARDAVTASPRCRSRQPTRPGGRVPVVAGAGGAAGAPEAPL